MSTTSGIFNWGLKEKILSIVIVGVVILCGVSYFSYSKIKEVDLNVDKIGHEQVPITTALGEIKSNSHAIPRFMWLALAFDNMPQNRKKALVKVTEAINTTLENVEKVSKYQLSAEIKLKLSELTSSVTRLKEELPKAVGYLEANDLEKDKLAKDFLMQTMPPLALKVSDLINEITIVNQKVTEDVIKSSDSSVDAAVAKLVWIAVLAGVSLLTVGGWLAFQLTRQMFRITEEVATASSQVASASEQLNKTSESLSSASQEQASSIEETSASLAEIMGMVESNVKTAESSNAVANEVHSLSEETRQFMESLAEAMKAILDSNGRIEKLVKVIEEIGEKTEVIDDIVFKTQLLSFNASVEAERAGEHGRGFAVVAQEVGNLAQMSGKAATEIASIVKTSIKEAESVAQENKVKVEKGGDLAFETKNRMVEVLKRIAEILNGTTRIVTASKEQSQGINQITQSVENLNRATQETASTAEESSSASQELASQSETLMSLVGEMRKLIIGNENIDMSNSRSANSSGGGESRHSTKVISFSKKTGMPLNQNHGVGHSFLKSQTNTGGHRAPVSSGSGLKLAVGGEEATTDVPSHTDEAWEKI
jgi:methyl-accepting chemotaxis protein